MAIDQSERLRWERKMPIFIKSRSPLSLKLNHRSLTSRFISWGWMLRSKNVWLTLFVVQNIVFIFYEIVHKNYSTGECPPNVTDDSIINMFDTKKDYNSEMQQSVYYKLDTNFTLHKFVSKEASGNLFVDDPEKTVVLRGSELAKIWNSVMMMNVSSKQFRTKNEETESHTRVSNKLFYKDEIETYKKVVIDDVRITNRLTSVKYTHALKTYVQTTKNGTSKDAWKDESLAGTITARELYDSSERSKSRIEQILHIMATSQISSISQIKSGTQFKLLVEFEGEPKVRGLVKPARLKIEEEGNKNLLYFAEMERHNSEIAAYHLDKILGFRKAPPVVGRTLDIENEILKMANKELKSTFFISPTGNICFHGKCAYYCNSTSPICGNPDKLDVSIALHLPSDTKFRSVKHPWRRSYNKRKEAKWETNMSYCDEVKTKFENIPEIVDLSIFDFLIGNMDRHHLEQFKVFQNDSQILHLDQGRSFTRSESDEISILAPLIQCCLIRKETLLTLLTLEMGHHPHKEEQQQQSNVHQRNIELYKHEHQPNTSISLGEMLGESLKRDALSPVLSKKHLQAIDRRLSKVLSILKQRCLTK